MSKFKVGDKVLTPLGVGVIYAEEEFIIDLDEWCIKVVVGERFGFNRVITFEVNDLKPYKTPHERLLDMGFNFWDNSNGLQYDRKEIVVLIDKETKTYKTYWVVDDMAFSVDLELAEVLVDYLKELENE